MQIDGDMWVTNSVFEGAGDRSRAIDVPTKDGGFPRLLVQGARSSCRLRITACTVARAAVDPALAPAVAVAVAGAAIKERIAAAVARDENGCVMVLTAVV